MKSSMYNGILLNEVLIMKSLIKYLNKRKHIVFIDLEGTQFSHEMIAFGAVKVDLDHKYRIKKIYPDIKCYVKPVGHIGKFVEELTSITPQLLEQKGISYKEALEEIKKYCGLSFKKSAFMTFGNHDLRIIAKSLEASSNADKEIAHQIIRNNIDLCAILSQYVKDENGNPYSLINYLKLFGVTPLGEQHDPRFDAKNLMLLYKAVLKSDDKIYEEYLKVLKNMKHFPEPIHNTIVKLINGADVTSEEFKNEVKNYIN